jgi:biotin-(acetyl-CoA carboxylase) ligase
VVGVGINLTPQLEHRCNDIEPGFILSSFSEIDNEKINELPKELYSFVLKNRMSESKIKEEWEKQCLHLNSNVTILGTDKNVISTGIFQGVGPIGEALIKNSSGGIEKIVSGSLIFK